MSCLVQLRDEEQKCYLQAKLLDLRGDKVLVQLGGGEGSGQQRWVRWDLVHEETAAPAGFVAEQSAPVEVMRQAAGATATAWFDAEVVDVKGEFFKVRFDSGATDVVECGQIRPPTSPAPRAAPSIVKQIFPVADPKVFEWFVENQERVIADTCAKSGLLALRVVKPSSQLVMLGGAKSIGRAKMLLELHGRHVADMQRIHTERQTLASKLLAEKDRVATGVRIEFPVERELIGLVIGKSGRHLAETKKATGVDAVQVDASGPSVVVIGPTQESVEAAKEMLEFVSESIPVQNEQIGWLIGKNGRNFRELQEKTKVTRLNLNKASNQVVLVGTRSAVEAAKLYIETHLQFLSEVEGEQRETERLRHELRGISIGDNEAGGRERARGGQRGGERGTERGTERGGGRGARDVAPTANGRAGHGRDGVPTTCATAAEMATGDWADESDAPHAERGGDRGGGGGGGGGDKGGKRVRRSGGGRGGRGGRGEAAPSEGDNQTAPAAGRGRGRGGGPVSLAAPRPASDEAEGGAQRPATARRAPGRLRAPRKEAEAAATTSC